MLSSSQIEEHVRVIEAGLGTISDSADLSCCCDIHARLESLRAQYRDAPHTLAAWVPQLAELRKQFDRLMASILPAAVDHYHDLCEQLHWYERERAFWRDVLIQASVTLRSSQVRGQQMYASVKSSRGRAMPPSGSPERQQLERLLMASGRWNEVSQLAKAKLEKAMQLNRFEPSDMQRLQEFCPETIIYTVRVQPAGLPANASV